MRLKYLVPSIALLLLVVSCTKDEAPEVANYPVVVSYLVAGEAPIVKLYRQKSLTDTATYGEAISGLSVAVSDGATSLKLAETVAGTYSAANTAFVTSGKTYRLDFAYLGNNVSALTTMPAQASGYAVSRTSITTAESSTGFPSMVDSTALSLYWNNPDSSYHMVVMKSVSAYPTPLRGRIEPLSSTVYIGRGSGFDLAMRALSYDGVQELVLFSVNKEYADMLQSNANTSSQKLSDPPGNITNGFGIFTGMQRQSLFVTVIKQ